MFNLWPIWRTPEAKFWLDGPQFKVFSLLTTFYLTKIENNQNLLKLSLFLADFLLKNADISKV